MPDLRDVIHSLRTMPELKEINRMHVQGDLDEQTKDRLQDFFQRRGREVEQELERQRRWFRG
jgi:hypothetical protein